MKIKILVLDGMNKNTLAIVRYLGKMKLAEIHVIAYQKASICFFSKYVKERYIITHPSDEKEFLASLIDVLKQHSFLVTIPVGYKTFDICTRNAKEISKYTQLFLPNEFSLKTASDKRLTASLAKELNVPTPATYDIVEILSSEDFPLRFPIVIKAPVELGKNLVSYATSRKDLLLKYEMIKSKLKDPNLKPLLQDYIRGDGFGFFAYYENGECRRIFMHQRIREYPASGGSSVCAKSFYDPKLFHYGKILLDKLQWNGVAMVEFKKDNSTGDYVLMEINPKFWGSLDLGLASGVNFPYFLVQRALNESVEAQYSFNTNVRFQWLLNGELYHCFDRPASILNVLRDMFRSKNDIWLRDLGPNLFQIMMIPIDIYKKIFH